MSEDNPVYEDKPTYVDETFDDEGILALTQKHRLRMLNKMTEGGKYYPGKVGEVRVLKELLKDLDDVVLTKKRIGIEERNSVSDEIVAKAIADINRKVKLDKMMDGLTGGELPVDDVVLDNHIPTQGELTPGQIDDDFDSFTKRVAEQRRKDESSGA